MKKLLFSLIFLPLFTYAQVIVTCAGGGTAGLGDGGPAVYAELNEPYAVNVDDSGNLYICDVHNYRIRKVSNPTDLGVGIITTIAGNGTSGLGGDNGLGTDAQADGQDIVVDRHGNVYIADGSRIRKITPTDTITTIAGTDIQGYNGDSIPATAAELNQPTGVAVDSIGNVYIADIYNYRIRKVDTSGMITTIAGTGIAGFSPDGSRADTARMFPFLVRINSAGTIYFADSARIRTINSAGIITTVAGNGILGYSGDSGLATSAEIATSAIALGTIGNIYFADGGSSHIRKIDTNGIITTIAGNGASGFYGDNGNPLLAEFDGPQGVAVDNNGNIYIGDVGNSRVRLITDQPVAVNTAPNNTKGISIYPNPCHDYYTIQLNDLVNELADVAISNITGQQVYTFKMLTNQPVTIQPDWPPGVYIISATIRQEHFTGKIIIQ